MLDGIEPLPPCVYCDRGSGAYRVKSDYGDWTEPVITGAWIVLRGGDPFVLSDAEFQKQYEPAPVEIHAPEEAKF